MGMFNKPLTTRNCGGYLWSQGPLRQGALQRWATSVAERAVSSALSRP